MKTADPNKHISEFLDYYCSMKEAPGFGVLLKGEWGSGKTWFINKYKDEKQIKAIYVSLYGLTLFSEIEDEFFRQLHPFLASKGMKLAGKILAGALKATVKIDLSDTKDEVSLEGGIPNIGPEYLTKLDDRILIFDDFERCKIETDAVLGYINHFVEHQGFKVILLAHEEEILKKEDDAYRRIKEKLIGKTFQVLPDLESAIDDFIEKLSDTEAKESLAKNKSVVMSINEMSQYKNLRVLKQALWDYERIYDALSDNAKAEPALVTQILGLSLAYSLETRIGKMLPSDIPEINAISRGALFGNSHEEESVDIIRRKNFRNKYRDLIPWEPVPSAKFWFDYFEKGAVNHDELMVSIENSKFFITSSTPDWVKLWHYRELNDSQFEDLLKRVCSEFDEKKYETIGTVMQVVGLLIQLSEIGLCKRKGKGILDQGKKLIRHLRSNKKLLNTGDSLAGSLLETGYAGLGFHSADRPEFQELCNYIEEIKGVAKEENMVHEADQLLELMTKSSVDFVLTITVSQSERQRYYNIPIFKYVNAKQFLSSFLSLSPPDQHRVAYGFQERYRYESMNIYLTDERDWLTKVAILFEKQSKYRRGKLSGYYLKSTSEEFRKMAEKLELGTS